MTNVGELDQVRSFLRDHSDLHNQAHHACGTTGCVAGWTVALRAGMYAGQALDDDIQAAAEQALPGSDDPVDRYAQDILGLTDDEAQGLFYNTLARGHDDCPLADKPDHSAEVDALLLIDALIARDKGDLCEADRAVLRRYCLPEEPQL